MDDGSSTGGDEFRATDLEARTRSARLLTPATNRSPTGLPETEGYSGLLSPLPEGEPIALGVVEHRPPTKRQADRRLREVDALL